MLEFTADQYNGVYISTKKLPSDDIAFGRELEASLKRWEVEGRRGVWLKLPVERASLLTLALEVS